MPLWPQPADICSHLLLQDLLLTFTPVVLPARSWSGALCPMRTYTAPRAGAWRRTPHPAAGELLAMWCSSKRSAALAWLTSGSDMQCAASGSSSSGSSSPQHSAFSGRKPAAEYRHSFFWQWLGAAAAHECHDAQADAPAHGRRVLPPCAALQVWVPLRWCHWRAVRQAH